MALISQKVGTKGTFANLDHVLTWRFQRIRIPASCAMDARPFQKPGTKLKSRCNFADGEHANVLTWKFRQDLVQNLHAAHKRM